MGMGPIVESSCDAGVGFVMTAGVGAEGRQLSRPAVADRVRRSVV